MRSVWESLPAVVAGTFQLCVLAGFAFFAWKIVSDTFRRVRLTDREVRRFKKKCPRCGYDMRAGHRECPECGGPGREREVEDRGHLDRARMVREWPAGHRPVRRPAADEVHVLLYATDSEADAMLLAQQLTARGMGAWIEKDDLPWDPTHERDRQRRVIVWSGDRDAAAAVLDTFRPAEARANS